MNEIALVYFSSSTKRRRRTVKVVVSLRSLFSNFPTLSLLFLLSRSFSQLSLKKSRSQEEEEEERYKNEERSGGKERERERTKKEAKHQKERKKRERESFFFSFFRVLFFLRFLRWGGGTFSVSFLKSDRWRIWCGHIHSSLNARTRRNLSFSFSLSSLQTRCLRLLPTTTNNNDTSGFAYFLSLLSLILNSIGVWKERKER